MQLKKIVWIVALLIFAANVSCRKCTNGCDVVYKIDGATLNLSDTLVSLMKANASTIIRIESFATKITNIQSCKSKSTLSCTEDAVDTNDLHLFCNKELRLNDVIYPMNTDLMQQAELRYPLSNGNVVVAAIVLATTADFPPGRYHFLLKGSTIQGKSFEDIAVIEWR